MTSQFHPNDAARRNFGLDLDWCEVRTSELVDVQAEQGFLVLWPSSGKSAGLEVLVSVPEGMLSE